MNKKKFLEALSKELDNNKCNDSISILEYYEELIEDQKEAGKKEKDIISSLDIDEIVKNSLIEERINKAVNKPTLSNGFKALIAALSILSLPVFIPIAILIFTIVIVVLSLILSLIITVGVAIFTSGASTIFLLWAVFTGKMPLATAIFFFGLSLIGIALFSTLLKWTIAISREVISWTAEFLKTRFNKYRKGSLNE